MGDPCEDDEDCCDDMVCAADGTCMSEDDMCLDVGDDCDPDNGEDECGEDCGLNCDDDTSTCCIDPNLEPSDDNATQCKSDEDCCGDATCDEDGSCSIAIDTGDS